MADEFVSIEGLRELEQAMEELTRATAKNQARKSLKSGGQVFADDWKSNVPRDQNHYYESIEVGTKLNKSQRRKHRKQDDVEMFVGSDDPAAIQQEFGNINHPPQPSARESWERTRSKVLRKITDDLQENIGKAVQRARRKALKNAN